MKKLSLLTIIIASVLLTANTNTLNAASPLTKVKSLATDSNAVVQTESEKANALFEEIFMSAVMRSPIRQSFLGIKTDQDKWGDFSEGRSLENHEIQIANLVKIKTIDKSKLDGQTLVSYRMAIQNSEERIADFKWRHHNYPLHQMRGTHTLVPSMLINQHRIADVKDAEAYIARLKAVPKLFSQVIDGLNIREEKGIIAPKFVYPYVLSDSNNIITGAPFDKGEDSTLLADFRKKINNLDIEDAKKEQLLNDAIAALKMSVKPGYEKLISAVKRLEKKADSRDGVWKLPEGKEFFDNALARTTTTELTAMEIHEIGLKEVARIHDEMKTIMKKVKFKGDLKAFLEFMRNDKQFYYESTKEGKERYLSEATALINDMKTRLDELFIVKPKAELTVKAVEAFREKSAGKAFYQRPSMDGSRPGVYYANLYDMKAMPTYQMAALAYHEGIPGHHMQLAIAGELKGLPKFRKFGRFTAYTEGWGLYSEQVPKEIGYYQEPYSDFGRLAMELWRACRLVVDTGIHVMEWTREQGIEYYSTNTPNAISDGVKMVERHIVMPSQATAYKIGMLKILELRAKAKAELGNKFDIREFHEVVLKNGPVPLNILGEFVDEYIAATLK
ncbi:MAG: hypothetical protein ACI9IA_002560 [Enterobacterales bacterium]